MARQVTFTKEKIIEAGFEIVRASGYSNLTARKLGQKLGCTQKPIFSAFKNMEEVQTAVLSKIKEYFVNYMRIVVDRRNTLKGIGLRWIEFANGEPNLYRTIFMSATSGEPINLQSIVSNFDELNENVVSVIVKKHGLTESEAKTVYNQLVIHAHGMASLMVAGETSFSEDDVVGVFEEIVLGLVMYMKSKR